MNEEAKNDAQTGSRIEVPGQAAPESDKLEEGPLPDFILEIRTYHDSQGRKVTERLPIHGADDSDTARFTGHANLQLSSRLGVGRAEVEFPIDGAKDPIQAFRLMDAAFNKYKPRIEQQARAGQQSIVIAKDAPTEPEQTKHKKFEKL